MSTQYPNSTYAGYVKASKPRMTCYLFFSDKFSREDAEFDILKQFTIAYPEFEDPYVSSIMTRAAYDQTMKFADYMNGEGCN